MTEDHAFGPDPTCFMCKAPTRWIHRVDERRQHFRKWGRDYQIRPVWSFCTECEKFYQAAQDEQLFEAMARRQERTLAEVEDDLRETFAAFRLGDRGADSYEGPDVSR